MSTPDASNAYQFRLKAADPALRADDVRRILEEEVMAAAADMARAGTPVDARAEMEGAFGGVGEAAVILLVAFAKGAAGAVGAAAGKLFFDSYLKPRLQKRNLLVSDGDQRPGGPH